jgi:8-oxo-dGTP pyrophosphatase MutT (NUDIX family)
MIPQNYVLGFIFSPSLARVLLVKKARPTWQAGRFNGIGGHVEPGENIDKAMEREAEEEAGITPGQLNWHHFGEMSFRRNLARVFLYSARDPGETECLCAPTPDQDTEPIEWVAWRESIQPVPMMHNLHWLLPMAVSCEISRLEVPVYLQFP